MKEFLIENWYYLGAIFISIFSATCTLIRYKKLGKELSMQLILDIVKDKISCFTEDAEKFKEYSAEERQLFVLTRIKEYLVSKGVLIDDSIIIELIDKDILHTKKVNQREKDIIVNEN